MDTQMVFQRYEIKFLMSKWQRDKIIGEMELYMDPDPYGHSEIRNLYYDTESFQLIRTSMERPAYKEKLRLRSYGSADGESPVYVELKKKYMGVVYKRRIEMNYFDALTCLSGGMPMPDSQIGREIGYMLSYYGFPKPKVFLSYERDAFYDRGGSDFRITFDEKIRYREKDLVLNGNCYGIPLLRQDDVLMELKTSGSLPLWIARKLSELEVHKTSFSKYGCAYIKMNEHKGEYRYA